MDYHAEQDMELEALEAILMDDLTEIHEDIPEGWPSGVRCFSIAINPETEGAAADTSEKECRAELVFAHTPTYPDEPPLYKARSLRGLSDADMATLAALLDEQVEANIGMAMIYALVSAAQEWLQERVAAAQDPAEVDPAAVRKAADEAEERRLAEIRSHGTMVTPQTFAAWKARFDAEMALARAKLAENGAEKKDKGLTGKQFFRQLEANGQQAEAQSSEDEEDEEYYGEEEEDDDDAEDEEEEEDDEFLDDYLAKKK